MSKTHLFDLDGKIAFVSGASRGIGEAIAKLLAQQGAHVIVRHHVGGERQQQHQYHVGR
ncbi:SDR family NAD(P)-dependent oxidoreductase, partial [Pseudomonas aeruginosa]